MTKTIKRKPGRPALPKGEKRAQWLQVRVTEDEHTAFTAAAAARDLDVSEWVRQLCKRSAAQV